MFSIVGSSNGPAWLSKAREGAVQAPIFWSCTSNNKLNCVLCICAWTFTLVGFSKTL